MLKCADCGVSDGRPLYRANAFEEVGVWLCEPCHAKSTAPDKPAIKPELKEIVEAIHGQHKTD